MVGFSPKKGSKWKERKVGSGKEKLSFKVLIRNQSVIESKHFFLQISLKFGDLTQSLRKIYMFMYKLPLSRYFFQENQNNGSLYPFIIKKTVLDSKSDSLEHS